MLTRQRVIMTRVVAINPTPGQEFFHEMLDEPGVERWVSLTHGDWADMGEPETITVAIDPGDLLNP